MVKFMKFIIISDDVKIGAIFKRDLSMQEILTIFSKVKVPTTEDKDGFELEFKDSVKSVLSSYLKKTG